MCLLMVSSYTFCVPCILAKSNCFKSELKSCARPAGTKDKGLPEQILSMRAAAAIVAQLCRGDVRAMRLACAGMQLASALGCGLIRIAIGRRAERSPTHCTKHSRRLSPNGSGSTLVYREVLVIRPKKLYAPYGRDRFSYRSGRTPGRSPTPKMALELVPRANDP